MKRNSKKRDAILAYLRSTKEHPGAEAIYEALKPVYPSLSLATVYRNLNEMRAEGIVRSMGTVLGQERFDGTVAAHTHVICRVCGRIVDVDVDDVPVPEGVGERVGKLTGFKVTSADLQFPGICAGCAAKTEKEKLPQKCGNS